MHALRTAIAITWAAFWIYWLISAFGAKQSTGRMRRLPLNGVTGLSVFILIRVFHGGSLVVHSTPLAAIGALVFASGLALAVWARIHLGRNWGMPMTERVEPDGNPARAYRDRAGHRPARVDRRRSPDRLLLLLGIGRREEPGRDVPHGLSGVPDRDQDAHSIRPLAQ